MDDKDLNSLSQTSKNNSKKVQGILLSRKYFKAIKTNNITNIKQMLSTENGISFIIEKCKNKQENQKLWNLVITKNDIELLTQMKLLGIEMNLSENEVMKYINAFDNHEIFEFLLDFIQLNENIAYGLMYKVLLPLKISTTKKQQNSQFKIIKKLITECPIIKDELKNYIHNVIYSLNIPLVNFVITEFDIDINETFEGYSALKIVVFNLIYNQNKNSELAYEMFKHLLKLGADITKRDDNGIGIDGNDIYYYITQITDQNIQKKLSEIIKKQLLKKYIKNHQTSKY